MDPAQLIKPDQPNPQDYFVREAIQHAFTLPLPDAILYLRGLCELGGDIPAINKMREVLIHLSHCEHTLAAIRSGQIELNFTP